MSRRLTINVGFITNSSSCVFCFPKSLLDDPQVRAFVEAHELGNGYVGSNLWNRSACSSILITKGQKEEAKQILRSYDWEDKDIESETEASRCIDPNDDNFYVVYGDEYSDTTHIFCQMMSKALGRVNGKKDSFRDGYCASFN